MDFDVGARLREVRTARNLSQREIAARAGVANGMISLIEGNKTSPSVSSLKKILGVLGLTLSEFFQEEEEGEAGRFVFRHDELKKITPAQAAEAGMDLQLNTLTLRRVGTGQDSALLLLHEVYEPGADTGEPYAHEGEEGGFVIEGELLLEVDGRAEVLRPGDAYLFASTKPHRFRNIGPDRCIVVSASTPPTF